ncbi:condensation domain-containing protein, partial [Spinactinospora alkalitolerans]|uniref:condensation domain-containing protein n=1 Tax=Spinactinospora alkalitolerans TaxID=687207 RepID=UPI0031D16A8E
MSTKSGLEDIWPLSPLQEGLLFQSQLDEGGPDVYNVQVAIDLDGALDPSGLRAAAAALLRRHPNLRSAFRRRKSGQAVALIPKEAEAPWRDADLFGADEAERARELDRLAAAERAARFDPARPPLLRFLLVRLGAERHRLVLTHHHILLDGWSLPLLVRELFALHAAGGDPDGLARPAPYRDHLAWLQRRDRPAAEAAWRAALAGVESPTRLAPTAAPAGR